MIEEYRHQHGRILDCVQSVKLAASQIHQLSGFKDLGLAFDGEADHSFEALNGDLALHPMLRDFLATWQNEADDLQPVGLDQGCRDRCLDLLAQRSDVNDLSGSCVRNSHDETP